MPGVYVSERDIIPYHSISSLRRFDISTNAGGGITASVNGTFTLYGWGDNTSLQLGTTANNFRQIGLDTDWVRMSANNLQNFAIKTDGTLWAWGENDSNTLGTGTGTDTYVPTQIGSDTNWADVVVGTSILAIKSNGTLWGWGYNTLGELGLGDNNQRSTPTQIGSDTNWSKVYIGNLYYTLAIKSNGTLWGWGSNYVGRIGTGDDVDVATPTQIGSDTWVCAAAGWYASAGIKSNGTLWTWGDSGYGALGRGMTSDSSTSPVQVGSDTDWEWVTTGHDFMLAIKTDGTLWSWGRNISGELGLGNTGTPENGYLIKDVNTPTQVGSDTWSYVYAAVQFDSSVIGIQTDGTVWGWGGMYNNRLGYDYNIWYTSSFNDWISSPNQIVGITNVASASIGGNNTLLLKTDNTLYEGGYIPQSYLYYGQLTQNYISSSGTPASASTNYQLLTGSNISTSNITVKPNGSETFILSDNVLRGWGYNEYGQLGTADSSSRYTPIIVSTNVNKIATGNQTKAFTTIIKTDGTLWVAGDNSYGQLGLGDYDNRTTFTQVGVDTNWIDVSTNERLTHAIKSDGTLWAWGYGLYGVFGTSSLIDSTTPVQLGTGSNWQKVFVGTYHAFAIQSDNTLWAWGNNYYGQLGTGDTSPAYDPIQIGSDADWYHVSLVEDFTVAQKTNGTLWAWGRNNNGQLGIGNTTNQLSPVPTGNGGNYLLGRVQASDKMVLAIKEYAGSYAGTGKLWGWGNNVNKTLGLSADNTVVLSPTQIGTNIDWYHIGIGGSSVIGIRYII